MKKLFLTLLALTLWMGLKAQDLENYPANYAREPRFNALLVYDPQAEEAHVQFDKQAAAFFHKLTYGEGYKLTVTTDFSAYYTHLSDYDVLIWLNFSPTDKAQRDAFQHYMEQGGGWVGFHATAYNDKDTHWPWYNTFLGCGIFLANQWPPQCALLTCDTNEHAVTRNLPKEFVAAPSEYYMWLENPRKNPDVDVLVTLSEKNYPFGIKDVITLGDFPVVWTNNKYRMIYLNMGHGDESFISPAENLLFTNAFRWVVSRDPKGDPFKK